MANYVLVHGGMVGGDCWDDLRAILQERRHAVWTPTMSGVGERRHLAHPAIDLETHIGDVVEAIDSAGIDDIVLVGHSYGGMVISGVADRIPHRIRRLVYVAAVLPRNGESMFDAVGPAIASWLQDAAHQGNGWEVPPGSPHGYGIHDPAHVRWFVAHATPHPIACFRQQLRLCSPSPSAIAKAYVNCAHDAALEPMARRAQAMGLPCYEVMSGHFPMLTAPAALADVLETLDSMAMARHA